MTDAMDPTPLPPAAPPRARRMALHTQILIGLLIGAVLGLTANVLFSSPTASEQLNQVIDNVVAPLGKVFLRVIFMVVVPLVVSALALGVIGLGDVRHLGRVGLRTLALTAVFSSAAVVIGVSLVNTVRPGDSLSTEQRDQLKEQYRARSLVEKGRAEEAKSISQTLLDIIPENPFQEIVGALDGTSPGNGMLAVMFFALCMGIAITAAGEKCNVLAAWLEGLFEMSMVIIGFAMKLAPYAVACLVFTVTARVGFDIVRTLGWFVATVLVGLAIQMFVVYPIALKFVARRRPWEFFRLSSEAIFTAFGTSSSNATLPTSIKVAEKDLGIPPKIANFVLTVGATGNQNGTALFEGVVVLFLAQVFGIELTVGQQLTVVLMSVLAGVGTAGIPGGSIPLIVVVMQSVGVPAEGIGIILGVDRVLDMCRTTLNVTGDLAIAACVARWDDPTFRPVPAEVDSAVS